MLQLVIAVILLLVALAAPFVVRGHNEEYGDHVPVAPFVVAPVVVAAILVASACVYGQDAGEVVVKINIGGSLGGYTEEAGFHIKAPWQNTVSYDVRNNLINLYRDAEYAYDGGAAQGACVTVNDQGGASADVDLQVVYSLDGHSALKLYEDYGTQEKFTSDVILNDVRATAREVAGQFDTITLLTNRGEFTKGLREALTQRWDDMGLNVEQVSIQDVRYPDSIKDKYAEAQAAEVAKAKALNDQETAKVSAETKKIEAQGEADANRVLTESLTPEVIAQHYVDTLREIGKGGNLVVVPEGSTPMVHGSGGAE